MSFRPDPRPLTDLGLLHELLDAELDTIELMQGHDLGLRWAAHVDYLRSLYRHGQSLLTDSHPGRQQ